MGTILEINNLTKVFVSKKTRVKALTDVSFKIQKGQTIGIVGESGCGKTTLGRCIARAYNATSGEVLYTDENNNTFDFLKLDKKALKKYRKDIQMIFQDPYSSLDPRMTVFDIISEPLKANYPKMPKSERNDRVIDIARKTGLNTSYLKRYPHAFSGGQRQRIGIARALVIEPKVIICDESVSALDVSIQAQVINLLKELQNQMNLTYIFISHDLSVVEYISDKVGVMYLGKLIEFSDTKELFSNPEHPYTEALLSAVPIADPLLQNERLPLVGEIPNPSNPPTGCYFHPRCRYKTEICEQIQPKLDENDEHKVACHLYKNLKLQGIKYD
ncbi:MAG: ABC transporter ATP-binding protein [Pleomorphochaeta sp.]